MKRTASRPSTPAAPRLIGYVRVSTADQADRGLSLAAQRDRLEAYATAAGFVLAGLEQDAGLSGGLAPHKRPGLARALEAVRRGDADGIVVTKLDRLSRSTKDTLALVEEADRRGYRLVSVAEALDTGTATGRFVVTLLGALGQMEREQIGERTATAMARIAREGRARSRFLPFGYRLEGSDATEATKGDRTPLERDEGEAAILEAMLALRAEGKRALRIANALNAKGTVNPRTGAPWNRGTVAAILATHDRRARALASA
jgi:DNA invertase Pin-like site-specific DNA recombinase